MQIAAAGGYNLVKISPPGRGIALLANLLTSELYLAKLKKYCNQDEEQRAGLSNIMDKLSLSARATHRVIKMARTISDFEGSVLRRERDLM